MRFLNVKWYIILKKLISKKISKTKITSTREAEMNNNDELIKRIKRGEGLKLTLYKDSLGYATIGWGRLLDPRKGGHINTDEAELMLANDIQDCKSDLCGLSWYAIQDEVRQGVLIELVFNMGMSNLLQFKQMIAALKIKDYKTATSELLDSKWATQIQSSRVQDICSRLKTGLYN